MPVLLGYCDPQSVALGETVRFMVSCEGAPRYRADIVHLTSPAAGPEAPPMGERVVDAPINGDYDARQQEIPIGSWGVVPASPLFVAIHSFTVQAFVWPTLPGRGRQALLGTWSETAGSGFGLGLDAAGALELRLGDGRGGLTTFPSGTPLAARRWYRVAASFDASNRAIVLYQEPLDDHAFHPETAVHLEGTSAVTPAPGPGPFLFAAWHVAGSALRRLRVGGHFNGKIDRPRLADRPLDREEIDALADGRIPPQLEDAVVAAWNFSRDISSETLRDVSANRLDGCTVNLPARAVTGYNWSGEEMDWKKAPEQYGAIHFHEDDLLDAGWETDFAFTVPAGLRSGAYAARLSAGNAYYHIPFYVRPPRGAATAKIAYLAATATYTAYTNNVSRFTAARTEVDKGRLTVLDAIDSHLLERPEMGLSCYDRHRDGSGVYYSSRLRPANNIRPDGRLWNYAVDLFVIHWLEHVGEPYEVITDEDLHREGPEILAAYRVLVTGSHPEYYSLTMLDAVEDWLRRGGRLMYLGGNGFYWRIAYHPERPGVIELRRAEDGARTWEAAVGEYYHSFTGEYGGMWRRNYRPPNKIAGVGFIAQGFDASSHYRRRPESRDPRAAFVFKGVEDEILGDFGVLDGGAAGLELDRYDPVLGSPPHALVVASSEDHSNLYLLVNEEIGSMSPAIDGVHNPDIHADMVFFETEGGGAVFSTGSIAYAGSLGHDGYDNNIAKLTTNVLRRFLDETLFEMPARPGRAEPD